MRRGYAAAAGVLLLVELGIALWVHDCFVRPHVGDSLAVMLVYCGVRAVTRWRWWQALAVALSVAVLVELSQLAGLATWLGFVKGSAGEVVLGSGYDPRDFLAYAGGGVVIAVVEWWRRP